LTRIGTNHYSTHDTTIHHTLPVPDSHLIDTLEMNHQMNTFRSSLLGIEWNGQGCDTLMIDSVRIIIRIIYHGVRLTVVIRGTCTLWIFLLGIRNSTMVLVDRGRNIEGTHTCTTNMIIAIPTTATPFETIITHKHIVTKVESMISYQAPMLEMVDLFQ